MQKKSVKQQHYVPRVYLRRFTIDGERLYVYDKIKDEIRGPENIKNVAQERFFYDLPVDTIPSNLDPQAEEKALSELEGQFHIAIEAALRVVEGKGADLHLTFRQCSEQCRIFPRRFSPLGISLDDSLALLGRQAGTLAVRRLYTT